jgi:carbonic anhydrase
MNTNTSPKSSLKKLIDGNRRFVSGIRSVDTLAGHLKMAELAQNGQKPHTIVLTCSDSRSPVEMIFDQGLGEVFVVRVAGNVVAPSLLASIEFAAANFGSSLILVMGHTKCGAVNATFNHVQNPGNALPSPHLEELVARIRPAVEKVQARGTTGHDHSHIVEDCTIENVRRSMNLIMEQSSIVRGLVAQGKIAVEGAVLDIANGKVNFLNSSVVAEQVEIPTGIQNAF